jgi:hypothetical protein
LAIEIDSIKKGPSKSTIHHGFASLVSENVDMPPSMASEAHLTMGSEPVECVEFDINVEDCVAVLPTATFRPEENTCTSNI